MRSGGGVKINCSLMKHIFGRSLKIWPVVWHLCMICALSTAILNQVYEPREKEKMTSTPPMFSPQSVFLDSIANILIQLEAGSPVFKIGDLGNAVSLDDDPSNLDAGDNKYMAPEHLKPVSD